jgi:hypothetical protein
MSFRYLVLICIAGVVGAILYTHGVPSWGVYIVRHIIYGVGH